MSSIIFNRPVFCFCGRSVKSLLIITYQKRIARKGRSRKIVDNGFARKMLVATGFRRERVYK